MIGDGGVRSWLPQWVTEHITVPAPALPPAPAGFPFVAVLAPLLMAGVLWAVTGTMYSLLFGLLAPVIALGSVMDSRRQRRRARGLERARYGRALDRLAAQVDDALARAREAWSEVPDPRQEWGGVDVMGAWGRASSPSLMVGRARVPSGIRLADDPEGIDAESTEILADLRRRASSLRDAPAWLPATGGIGILGPETSARAVARAIVLHVAGQCAPDRLSIDVPPGEDWAAQLPHRVSGCSASRWGLDVATSSDGNVRFVIGWAREPNELDGPMTQLIDLRNAESAVVLRGGARSLEELRPRALSRREAEEWTRALVVIAERAGHAPESGIPVSVSWADLPTPLPGSGALSATLGLDHAGPVTIDLARDGPHALVAGTTGSGKSELLTTWILALARGYAPRELTFLLVDYKGGAAFAPLVGLPHVAGVVSDLDAARTRRVVTALRAELRRRERLLATASARAIEELPVGALSRLVVVVDEYAALVREHAELQDLFTDLAARGRSLGLHLILCTQRPSGVVRDAILANVTLRIALRLGDRADSVAVVGSDAAASLEAIPGRAILATADGTGSVQFAQVSRADIAAVTAVADRQDRVDAFWLEELPFRVPASSLPAGSGGWRLGLVDRPEDQSRALAEYLPREHGPLLVLGAPRSGRSTLVATLVAQGGALVIPAEPADAVAALGALGSLSVAELPALVAVDDLDLLLAAAGTVAPLLVESVERICRMLPAHGIAVVLTAAGTTTLRGLQRGIGTRLLLRQSTRDDHLLVGLDPREFDPEAPPGRGWWGAHSIQVALPDGDVAALVGSATHAPRVPVVAVGQIRAIVSPRPSVLLRRLQVLGVEARELSSTPAQLTTGGPVLVGDPDSWQGAWGDLSSARRAGGILVDRRCSSSELRLLARVRGDPPPLADRDDEWWFVEDGAVRRVRTQFAAD